MKRNAMHKLQHSVDVVEPRKMPRLRVVDHIAKKFEQYGQSPLLPDPFLNTTINQFGQPRNAQRFYSTQMEGFGSKNPFVE